MKRVIAFLIVVLLLGGCSGNSNEMDRAISLRSKILEAEVCSFVGIVTADYGDKEYTFSLDCHMESDGAVSFEVIAPDEIKDIKGSISASGGKLTFDQQALLFELLADGQISPVGMPWIFTKTLRSGYIKGCSANEDGLYIQIDDSYADNALLLEVWTDSQDIPVRAELLWQGRRVLSMHVENFVFL